MKDLTNKVSEHESVANVPGSIEYIVHPDFLMEETRQKIELTADPALSGFQSPYAQSMEADPGKLKQRGPTIKRDQEVTLFLKYNLARYQAENARIKAEGNSQDYSKMEGYLKTAERYKADLVHANLPLVLAMAKRTRVPNVEFEDLISEGNMALLRAVEKFDVSRGFKFSTYACRAILKAFYRLGEKSSTYHQRFPVSYDPDLEHSDHIEARQERQREDRIEDLREIITKDLAQLSATEVRILSERFGLDSGEEKHLYEIGTLVGVSKERVRQVQNNALVKLRLALRRL